MEAARLLRDEPVDIRLVGPVHVSKDALNELNKTLTVVGEMPRSQIHAEYANADLFVLPTLSEGSATVCYEALAAGLPVVTTPNAGSVIRDGVDGMIVPIRDPQSLANQIAVLSRDRKRLDEMSQQALKTAGEYTWDQYGRRLIEVIARR